MDFSRVDPSHWLQVLREYRRYEKETDPQQHPRLCINANYQVAFRVIQSGDALWTKLSLEKILQISDRCVGAYYQKTGADGTNELVDFYNAHVSLNRRVYHSPKKAQHSKVLEQLKLFLVRMNTIIEGKKLMELRSSTNQRVESQVTATLDELKEKFKKIDPNSVAFYFLEIQLETLNKECEAELQKKQVYNNFFDPTRLMGLLKEAKAYCQALDDPSSLESESLKLVDHPAQEGLKKLPELKRLMEILRRDAYFFQESFAIVELANQKMYQDVSWLTTMNLMIQKGHGTKTPLISDLMKVCHNLIVTVNICTLVINRFLHGKERAEVDPYLTPIVELMNLKISIDEFESAYQRICLQQQDIPKPPSAMEEWGSQLEVAIRDGNGFGSRCPLTDVEDAAAYIQFSTGVLQRQSPQQLLGSQFAAKYRSLSMLFHPDKIPHDSTLEQKKEAAELFKVLSAAYQFLTRR